MGEIQDQLNPQSTEMLIQPKLQNFPWQLTMIPLVNAIAAGCPMLIKVSNLLARTHVVPGTPPFRSSYRRQFLDAKLTLILLDDSRPNIPRDLRHSWRDSSRHTSTRRLMPSCSVVLINRPTCSRSNGDTVRPLGEAQCQIGS